MDAKDSRSAAFRVRSARPEDIPALMRLKRLLAQGENALHAVCASEADWRRDGFGPDAGFLAFVAEDCSGVIGMVSAAGPPMLQAVPGSVSASSAAANASATSST